MALLVVQLALIAGFYWGINPRYCYYREEQLQTMLCNWHIDCKPMIINAQGDTMALKLQIKVLRIPNLPITLVSNLVWECCDAYDGHLFNYYYCIRTNDTCFHLIKVTGNMKLHGVVLKDITGDHIPELISIMKNTAGNINYDYKAWQFHRTDNNVYVLKEIEAINGLFNISYDSTQNKLYTHSYRATGILVDTIYSYRWGKNNLLISETKYICNKYHTPDHSLLKSYRYDTLSNKWIMIDSMITKYENYLAKQRGKKILLD